ncbi:uncharacterized protein ColSpa_06471 [Colletotrichum spaethianum]|uniref:Uncharacterized protein n=1 Tax=Colletotrichum spaethianum TaxID=700344 RepID=A0AA37LGU7_9PEZI|nr:uncharacterized protein ColSpa_06471 [Colletotrichum spaethianum]GKT46290.1 hypothetical protein ColSpa_06471 [Colletotrichum spaethianum]
MAIEVRRFVSKPEDQVNYVWLDEGSGVIRETALEPYALASGIDSRRAFDEYIEANAVTSWEEKTKRGDTNQLILDHYTEALEHYRRVSGEENVIEQRLLLNFIKLRFALPFGLLVMFANWLVQISTPPLQADNLVL